jgi:uncharacterized membrane protein YphA (DoxX/SURF4 family)
MSRRPQPRPTWPARINGWISAPQPVERLELLRVLLPLAILGFFSARLWHVEYWLSPLGFQVPRLPGSDYRQPLYLPALPPGLAVAVAVATVVAGLAVAAGLRTRLASGLFAALLAYLALADRLEAFTVSKLSPVLMLALCLSPAGARYSLDAVLRRRRDPTAVLPTEVPGSAVRFFQLLLVTLYSASGIAKMRGDWLTGPALWSHLHDDYQTAFAYFLVSTLPVRTWTFFQWMTLAYEVGAPLWFSLRPTRTAALLVGLSMHAIIGLSFGPVIWFSLLMALLLFADFAPARWLPSARGRAASPGGDPGVS